MYTITQHTKDKADKLGLTVKPSTQKHKKIDVYKDNKKIASIGALGMSDYPTYLQTKGKVYADERKRLYHLRHTKNSLGEELARKLLWT
jgi:hypothetical protein